MPGLELQTKDEIRRFALGKLRKEQKIADKKEFDETEANIDLDTVYKYWTQENCKVKK